MLKALYPRELRYHHRESALGGTRRAAGPEGHGPEREGKKREKRRESVISKW